MLSERRSARRKEHSISPSSTFSWTKKKKKNPRKSQTTVDSHKTHPGFWESFCSEFGAWYVMLVGMLKLSSEVNFSSNTMRIHSFCVGPAAVPKIEGGGGAIGVGGGGWWRDGILFKTALSWPGEQSRDIVSARMFLNLVVQPDYDTRSKKKKKKFFKKVNRRKLAAQQPMCVCVCVSELAQFPGRISQTNVC